MDKIYHGQVLHVPRQDPILQNAQIWQPGHYYSSYGLFDSWKALQNVTTELTEKNIKFLIISSNHSKGGSVLQILIGGYETSADLSNALEKVETQTE
jgi:hypothetical protein